MSGRLNVLKFRCMYWCTMYVWLGKTMHQNWRTDTSTSYVYNSIFKKKNCKLIYNNLDWIYIYISVLFLAVCKLLLFVFEPWSELYSCVWRWEGRWVPRIEVFSIQHHTIVSIRAANYPSVKDHKGWAGWSAQIGLSLYDNWLVSKFQVYLPCLGVCLA